ncbi:MAG: HAD-IIB family hydrolase [Nitrospirae bacterium]|nr:HAD-IIB family hydrolase [Nitrospirota bacterium]
MVPVKKIVIFSDLDGALLHPKTYAFEAALPALGLIRERNIPLVLCSSKTRAEIEVYKPRLGNDHPFISENGGGIFIPEGYFSKTPAHPSLYDGGEAALLKDLAGYHVIVLGKPYEEIRKTFSDLRDRLNIGVKGFGDMTAEDIAELTGLTFEEASLAKLRDFGEPFVFEANTDERFLKAIEDSGFHWTQGKLHHIIGDNDKGKAVYILKGLFEREMGEFRTIGLGDGFNDLPMLKKVDLPVLIPKEDGDYDPRVKLPNLIKAEGIGPDGWNKAIMELLQTMR